ncbi:hypothetical protein A2Z33_00910 [Candidatus Gottesmanbacteria bacterium RBG_16_52_11]|uniref:Mannosyl-glycoprotein endo-beta-N-acetylglucosamidase-like domain-containing protein n=1 Tax=Candidatus Gottesmanbacteria bacterium RBG_16_52_11 TaxID=1798374 RepID=A0A1F5YNV1_9BACT|nr:MAG: hypothetical protein A2Z33_00910 [Candidatus Gottesmanbacteria bacterium RBG_16_52_11]
MIRKVLILFAWFPLAAITIGFNINLLTEGHDDHSVRPTVFYASPLVNENNNPLKGSGKILGAAVVSGDGRELLLSEFLKDSPLAPYAGVIVAEADLYDMDYRIIPAIAMCESNLGRRIPSRDSFNAWGIAVYSGASGGARFTDWPGAIQWVTRYVHEKYTGKGIIDLKSIGSIWAPPSVDKGHSWANCVETFMKTLE